MAEINYKNYLTGKKEIFILKEEEELTDFYCPIDGTLIVHTTVNKIWEGYRCPNCDTVFTDFSEEGLINSRKDFLDRKKERLERLIKEELNLFNLIKRLEK